VLLANLDGHTLGLTLFDEAHRTVSHEYKELVYGSTNIGKYEKQVFLTATPINRNGITMYDRENNDMGIYGDCGPLHRDCHYTYLNGLRDDVLSLFNIRIDMFSGEIEKRKISIYECIARSILATGNSRVLTFHKDVAIDSSSDTSVLRFIQNGQTEFKFAFDRICANEFPEKIGYYNKITMIGLTAETRDKKEVLAQFGKCDDNEIFILASCKTIGEGVDTKNANMTVFVDPKTSVKDIIQNIGRVCRKIPGTNGPAATVLIPVWVDMQKYRDCGDDVEKRDEVLREQLNIGEKGDYNAVLKVFNANYSKSILTIKSWIDFTKL
jgi:superfamily II DNA or RNA helicase